MSKYVLSLIIILLSACDDGGGAEDAAGGALGGQGGQAGQGGGQGGQGGDQAGGHGGGQAGGHGGDQAGGQGGGQAGGQGGGQAGGQGGATECGAGQFDCGGTCSRLIDDADHCGSCGNACARSAGTLTECIAAECYQHCPEQAGQPVSIEFSTDPENCGRCGQRCEGELRCMDGRCGCRNGTACGDTCVDLQADRMHCGACGNTCPQGGRCEDGRCACPAGQTDCNGVCVDQEVDANHCGACNNRCPNAAGGDAVCAGGECQNPCGPGGAVCGGACTLPAEDPEHCGVCDNSCEAFVEGLDSRRCPARANACRPRLDGCADGACQARVEFSWNRIDLLEDVTCDALCEARELTCGTRPRVFETCHHLRDRPFEFNQGRSALGCGVWADSGLRPTGTFMNSCYDVMGGFAGSGRHRESTACLCEARDGLPALVEGGPDDISGAGLFPRPGLPAGRADRMLLVLEETSFVSLNTNGSGDCGGDSVLDLRREGGDRVILNDDPYRGEQCAVVNRRLDAGRYEIRVRSFDGEALGRWALQVDIAAEVQFDRVRAPTVLDMPALPNGGYHRVPLSLEAPAQLVIETPDCPGPTSINLLPISGRSVSSDDADRCARVVYDGGIDNYVITVRGRNGQAVGDFRLSIDWE